MSTVFERFVVNEKVDIDALFTRHNLKSLESGKLEQHNRFRFYNWSSSWRMIPCDGAEMSVELLWGKTENELPSYYPRIGIDENTGLAKWKSVFVISILTENRMKMGRAKRIVVPAFKDASDTIYGFVKAHSHLGGEAGRSASRIAMSVGQIEAMVGIANKFAETCNEADLEKDIELAVVTMA